MESATTLIVNRRKRRKTKITTNERPNIQGMKRRFGELEVGARFCFGARRYEKVAAEIGRDEDRGGNVFHLSTEVLIEMQSADCRLKDETRKPSHLSATLSPRRKEALREGNWWLPPLRPVTVHGRRGGRLGKEPDRELRPYGTP